MTAMLPQGARQRIAAYAILTEGDRVLLCRITGNIPSAGSWTLPGGGIDFGEHPNDAVVREVREETGFRIEIRGIAAIDSDVIYLPEGQMQAVRIVYRAEIISGELTSEVGGSTDMCEWLTYEECLGLPLVPLAKRALKLVFG